MVLFVVSIFKNLILNVLDDRIFPILGVTCTIFIYLSETDLGGGVGRGSEMTFGF